MHNRMLIAARTRRHSSHRSRRERTNSRTDGVWTAKKKPASRCPPRLALLWHIQRASRRNRSCSTTHSAVIAVEQKQQAVFWIAAILRIQDEFELELAGSLASLPMHLRVRIRNTPITFRPDKVLPATETTVL